MGSLWSQTQSKDGLVSVDLNNRFQTSLDYLASFKNDSAALVLNSIYEEISDTPLIQSEFGLRVQFRIAEALERDSKEDLALVGLQAVKEKAKNTKLWDVYARACINLALIYEKIGKKDDCIQNLRSAQRVLKKNKDLEHIYPHFYVRISSYHRIYDNLDSAKYYAIECLNTYEKHDEYAQGADGYMLMTMLSAPEGLDTQINYAKKAAKIFRKLENHTGLGYMLAGISKYYFQKGEYDKALLYNDSTILTSNRSINGGFDLYHSLYNAYKFRGAIFQKKQLYDSSSFNLKKGYELQNEHIQKESYEKVLAIDAKYKNDQKELKIEEQAKQLKSQQIQRTLLFTIFGLVTLFAIGLSYYTTRLRRANAQAIVQAEEIKSTNKKLTKSLNRQIILQGEVHHRVKNNLQVIISLLDLQKKELSDPAAINQVDSMSKRIYSMAAIHNLLYQKEDMEFIKLQEYIENLCFHFSNFSIEAQKPTFNLTIEDIDLNLETSMPIGIIITELLTNSLKYGRVTDQKLIIDIDIVKELDELIITYQDNGKGFEEVDSQINSSGLGFYILDSMTRQLQGKLERRNNNGAYYQIKLKEKNRDLN